MNVRLVLASVIAVAVGGGIAAPAFAADSTNRHVVCVLDGTPAFPNQEGFCVGFDDPKLPIR